MSPCPPRMSRCMLPPLASQAARCRPRRCTAGHQASHARRHRTPLWIHVVAPGIATSDLLFVRRPPFGQALPCHASPLRLKLTLPHFLPNLNPMNKTRWRAPCSWIHRAP